MNIKEHIEAGHYPTDEKGRALIQTRCGATAVIAAVDHPYGDCPIIGWTLQSEKGALPAFSYTAWTASGRWEIREDGRDLMPPLPRRVKVTRWAEMRVSDQAILHTFSTPLPPSPSRGCVMVELSGCYEEPWT